MSFDVRHRLVLNGVYDLPFGEGRRWLNEGIGAAILGGWQITPAGAGKALAGRVVAASESPQARIDALFAASVARSPSPEERKRLIALLDQQTSRFAHETEAIAEVTGANDAIPKTPEGAAWVGRSAGLTTASMRMGLASRARKPTRLCSAGREPTEISKTDRKEGPLV